MRRKRQILSGALLIYFSTSEKGNVLFEYGGTDMKRKLALALVMSMTLTALAGCGGAGSETAASGETAAVELCRELIFFCRHHR